MFQPFRRDAPIFAALAAAGCGGLVLAGLVLINQISAEAALAAAVLMAGCGALVGWWTASQRDGIIEKAEAPARVSDNGAPSYARLLDALPDPVLVIVAHDPDDLADRRYVLTNAAARDLFRIQNEQGALVTVIRDPQVLEAVDEALFGALASEATYEVGGAQARSLRAITRPLDTNAQGARTALLVVRDETDIRRAERTRADFLANASHELRTPLASLSGFIETLKGHARTDEAARDKFLGIMEAQAERMSRLIDDLLSLSRIELNEHNPPIGSVDLALTVKDVLDSLGPLAKERSVRFETHLPLMGEAMSIGDRDQVIQVIQNLVDNALKYSPTGGAIAVSLISNLPLEAVGTPIKPDAARLSLLTPDYATGTYIALRVSDAGPGLARDSLPRLTERFYRVEGQKSGARSGTGLGLAIVKHIMNRHRGGMLVESTEGAGATFVVYFPQSRPQDRDTPIT